MNEKENSAQHCALLIVDDEEAARYGMRRGLQNFCDAIHEAADTKSARVQIEKYAPQLILLDVNLPGESGLDLLRALKAEEKTREICVIMITAHGTERTAVEAIKAGAHDYLAKPFELDDLRLAVKNALETVGLRRENQALRRRIETENNHIGSLLGNSEPMRRVRAMIEKVAETDASVLVRGESGTGKELVARALHELNSARRNQPFVAVNCAALPTELIESELFGHEKGAFTGAQARRRGKFEQADGGTLFLDEIGDMSATVQAKLLRALEERKIERLGGNESLPVDVRVVSATHRPLESDITTGAFRADLFYRLRVVTIELPPLRERREDIPLLAQTFLARAAERYNLAEKHLSSGALKQLLRHDWGGNIRELKHTIEHACIMADGAELSEKDLPAEMNSSTNVENKVAVPSFESIDDVSLNVPYSGEFRVDKREFERRYIARCLEDTGGNVTKAATIMGMHRQSLQYKLRELGLMRRYVTGGEEVSE